MFIKRLIFICLSLFVSQSTFVFAQTGTLTVQVCFTGSSVCNYVPPSFIQTIGNIDKIYLTFTDLSIQVDGNTYVDNRWGVQFQSSIGGSTFFRCTQLKCVSDGFSILADPDITVQTLNGGNVIKGSLILTLADFKDGRLPADLRALIDNAKGNLTVAATYSTNPIDNTGGGGSGGGGSNDEGARASNAYFWGSDLGGIIQSPLLSVLARFGGFAVNIQPPSNQTSVAPDPTAPQTTLFSMTDSNATTLIRADAGHVSGYLLAFWLARDLDGSQPCDGQWQFAANPLTYNPAIPAGVGIPYPTLSCAYSPDVVYADTKGMGGTSSALGCIFGVPGSAQGITYDNTNPYFATAADIPNLALDANLVAVPAIFASPALKIAWLKTLISNPAKLYSVPGTCMNVVFVPSTQSSYGYMGIKNGQVFGVTGWTLNYAFSTTDPTPNLSLEHSNVAFITGVDTPLASTAKTSSLPMTKTDCFVATAASGDINSNSVFYWRVLRDEYLTKLGFTKFYSKHGPQWAQWLNEHDQYKPAVNFILENTGAFFYFSTLYTKQSIQWTSEHSKPIVDWTIEHSKPIIHWTTEHVKKFMKFMSNLWENEVFAAQSQSQTQPQTKAHSTPTKSAQNVQPNAGKPLQFDFALAAGVLFPTTDKNFYDKYYASSPPVDLELSSSALFWTSNLGWSIGLKGIYLFADHASIIHVLGNASQKENLELNDLGLEVIGGVRYRNSNFLFLQPGVFAGAGVWRLREEAKANGDSGQNGAEKTNQTLGVTKYSPVFDFGANLDVSLSTIFMYSERELALSRDILLRLSAIYRLNPTNALSATGLVVTGGFAFLF